jgi:putative transposase
MYEDTANKLLIYQYIQSCREKIKGEFVVILDNARVHKTKELLEYCKRHKIHLLFLPPYSPDLNKIEKIWGAIKKIFSRLIEDVQTVIQDIQFILDKFSIEK